MQAILTAGKHIPFVGTLDMIRENGAARVREQENLFPSEFHITSAADQTVAKPLFSPQCRGQYHRGGILSIILAKQSSSKFHRRKKPDL